MLEILVLLALVRPIERMAAKKGEKPYRWRLIVVGAWFGSEFAAAFLTYLLTENMLVTYLVAIGCAVASYFYVKYKLNQKPDMDLLETIGQEVQ
ncbi:MAG: hypothetical protein K0Q79_2982 [Flavipsychrobacter sp.]|jgi:hypothetical protein|nr:hypothetical protein [Flavipsychrobacter sp.]